MYNWFNKLIALACNPSLIKKQLAIKLGNILKKNSPELNFDHKHTNIDVYIF